MNQFEIKVDQSIKSDMKSVKHKILEQLLGEFVLTLLTLAILILAIVVMLKVT